MKKKILIVLAVVLALLAGAVIVLPVIFKDDIKAALDEQLAASINAEVLYEIDNFSVSLLPHFPNLTVGIRELGVINREPFAGQVLFAARNIEVEINLWKLITGDQLSLQGIYLEQPNVFIKVLADGTANYDIAVDSGEEAPDTTATEEDFSIAIEKWQISKGAFVYDDASLATYLELDDLNHSGNGNFSLSVFDLDTRTSARIVDLAYEGVSYLSNRQADIDMVLNMNLDEMKFTFRENRVRLNDFAFGFDGWVAMPADDIDMDIRFASRDNSFKSLLSLIPAIYARDFDELETSGSIGFSGRVNGTYNDTTLPAYDLQLQVQDGRFHYPGLPEEVKEVNIDMKIVCADGNIDHTRIDISNFHVLFGREPFSGHLRIGNLVNYPVDLEVKTTLNLANLNRLFPMEGLEMAGTFRANLHAKGVYDSAKATIPTIQASLALENGRIAYSELPAPLEDFRFTATIENTTGRLNDTRVAVPDIGLQVGGSPLKSAFLLEELDDPRWEAALEGELDFAGLFPLINKLYPLPGTRLKGRINARMKTEGRLSDVEKERYERLTTSGRLVFDRFAYADSLYLPQGLVMESGEFAFGPDRITVSSLNMQVGRSDFLINGLLTNYLKYALYEDELLRGSLSIRSRQVDLNEWMSGEDTASGENPEEETSYKVVEVPGNIDFTMQAYMARILYDNLELREARGQIIIKNKVLYLDRLATQTLGGRIVFTGNYDTRNPASPTFDMLLDVQEVAIDQTYTAFNTVRMLAPLAGQMKGRVSTLFSLQGRLQTDMMPDMTSLNGSGKLLISEAELGDARLISGFSRFINGMPADNLKLNDMEMTVSIVNGRLNVTPFDLKLNNYLANIGGSTGLDGSLDYRIRLQVPAGAAGQRVNALLGKISGQENTSEVINLNLNLAGSYDSPRFSLLGAGSQEATKKAAVAGAARLLGGDDKLADSLANTDAKKLVEEQKKLAEAELQRQQDSLKKVAEEEARKAKEKALEEAGKQLKNLFGPKKKKNNNR